MAVTTTDEKSFAIFRRVSILPLCAAVAQLEIIREPFLFP
jgi:hypothetical protein